MTTDTSISGNDLVIKQKNVVTRVLDEETILMRVNYKYPFRLDKMGTMIWQLMDRHQRVGDLIQYVCDSFDVKREDATKDILAFLEKLRGKGLLKVG
jgi:hypothetical protein